MLKPNAEFPGWLPGKRGTQLPGANFAGRTLADRGTFGPEPVS
jgi:hypothetical protein